MTRRIPEPAPAPPTPQWTFLTNHAHVLLCIARDPTTRVRDLAANVGITERAVQRIIGDLEEAGFLTHARDGRRNIYQVHADRPLRHPVEGHRNVSDLIALVLEEPPARPAEREGARERPVVASRRRARAARDGGE